MPRPRRRNRFQLVLVPAVSAALLAFGCDRSPGASTRICVDPQGRRLSDDQCRDDHYPSSFHHWYYVSGGGVPIGGFVHSSSFRSSGSRFGSVSRGGFGSSAHASGAGG